MFPQLVIGFHGCSSTVAQKLLSGKIAHLSPSIKSDEWLGEGVYFWENDYDHALEWAKAHIKEGETPEVIGAIINPGNCFDLTRASWLKALHLSAQSLALEYQKSGTKLPKNNSKRHLYDCLLVNYARKEWESYTKGNRKIINTVRGAFYEGEPIGDSTFGSLNHIQWAVVTPEQSILGYFRPTAAMQKAAE